MNDCHNCQCHINAPCYECEMCAHWNTDDCMNDCQNCDIDHEKEQDA